MGTDVPKSRFAEFNLDPALAETAEGAPEQQIIEGILRLEDPDQVPPHFTVVSRFNRICTGRFPAEHAWTIRRHPNVISLKAGRPLGIHYEGGNLADPVLPKGTRTPGSSSTPLGRRGCLVAALDFGLDFAHPNFLNPDGTTQLVALWHQGAPYDQSRSNRFGYGRIFTREEINAALRASDPYLALGYHPSNSDRGNGSHATHTSDIATGKRQGPQLFVHLSTSRLGVVGDLGDSVRLLEALDWVDRTARDFRCPAWVVNLSVGATGGSKDGTSLVEQGMHELLRIGPGRAIVQSAGNYRSADLAAEGWLRDGEQRDLEWFIDPRDTTANEIDAWYSGNDRFVVAIRPPKGGSFVEVRLGEVADLRYNGNLVGRIYHRKNDPNNRDNHVDVFLYQGAPSGVWTLRLIGEYIINGRFHAWIERDLARPGAQSRFRGNITSQSYTLGTIATSPLVITVGAYDANAEGHPLAPFSSCGPTRDERCDKPELLAPGVGVVAARSIPRGAVRQEGLLTTCSGTSYAAPHVTRVVAAMFEAAGRPLSIDAIRDCLRRSAEPVTNGEHFGCCGWGRLNAEGAIRRIRGLTEPKLVSVPNGDASSTAPWVVTAESAIFDADTGEGSIASEEKQEEVEVPQSKIALMNSGTSDRYLDRAERALQTVNSRGRESEIFFLQRLLRELGGQASAVGLSPAKLLRVVLNSRPLMQDLRNALEVLAAPSQQPKDLLRPGDWLLRAVAGTGDVGHVSVLVSDDLRTPSALASEGIAAEGTLPGYYGIVIEAGAFPHSRSQPFARRFLDSRGCVPSYTVVLRPRYSHIGAMTDLPPDEPEANGEQRAVDIEEVEEFAGCPLSDDVGSAGQVTPQQAPTPLTPESPDSPVANRFVSAHPTRYCTPGQTGSATCQTLSTPRPIRRVVIHALAVPSTVQRSGVEAVVAGWQNAGRLASAHYLVDRDGTITQMVREADVAFHTPGNNRDSIGIEHADVCNDPAPLTTQLYGRSAALVRDLATRHGFAINNSTVAGHSQVNPNHGDPGPYWDWEYFFLLLSWAGIAASSRPIRLVTAAAERPATPTGWQVQLRRAIANNHCANQRDPWGATYWRAQPSATGTPAELSLVVDETGTYKVSLWWPDVAGANSAVPVDIEVACLASPCTGISAQTVTVNQHPNAGRWNDVAVVSVTQTPAELKVRWSRNSTQSGWVLVDAVRLLKIASYLGSSGRETEDWAREIAENPEEAPGWPEEVGEDGEETEAEAEGYPEEGEEEPAVEEGGAVTFPSGESLTIVKGEEWEGQEYYDPNRSGNPLLDTSGDNKSKRLSKDFSAGELAKSGGRKFDKARIDPRLVECLQTIHDHLRRRVTITSSYRSWGHNETLRRGGKKYPVRNSQHLSGKAADIRVKGISGTELAKAVIDAGCCNIAIGLGLNFIHVDVRGFFRAWPYGGDEKEKEVLNAQVEEIRKYWRLKCRANGRMEIEDEIRSSPVCEKDVAITDHLALLHSNKVPLPVTEEAKKLATRVVGAIDDYRAVAAIVPDKLDKGLLIYFHGNNNYVTMTNYDENMDDRLRVPLSVDPLGYSRIPRWTLLDRRAENAAKMAKKKKAVQIDDKLHLLKESQTSLASLTKSANGTMKHPLVLVPEDVELSWGRYWAVPPLGQYGKGGNSRGGGGDCYALIQDCYAHLQCLKKRSGRPYIDQKRDEQVLTRLYLCGHSGGGKPLVEAAGSNFFRVMETRAQGVDLWLLDCTYPKFSIKNYVDFCREWHAKGRLRHAPNASRLICVYYSKSDDTMNGAKQLHDKILELKLGRAPRRCGEKIPISFPCPEDVRSPVRFSKIDPDLLEALQKEPVVFIRTAVPHGRIPTVFIPLLLWSAAS